MRGYLAANHQRSEETFMDDTSKHFRAALFEEIAKLT